MANIKISNLQVASADLLSENQFIELLPNQQQIIKGGWMDPERLMFITFWGGRNVA